MPDVRFRLNRPKDAKGKDKKHPVSILVTLYINNSLRPELATGEKVLPYFWNNDRVKDKHPDSDRINKNLHRIEGELLQLWRDNINDLTKIRALMPAVVRGQYSPQKKRIFTALDDFLNQYSSEKKAITVAKYQTLKARLSEFSHKYQFDFESLDFNFYDQFKRYLYGIPNPNYKGYTLHRSADGDHYDVERNDSGLSIGLFDDTVYKYFVNLKTFLSWAEKRGYKVHPSYKTWEIIKRKHQPISITLEELEKLESKPMPAKHLEIAKDYLLLECYTGQRISDIKAINPSDCTEDSWTLTQKKGNRLSGKTVTVYFSGISEPAKLILQKYNFKMPAVSEQKINDNIKKVCEIAGITTEIYTDRWAGNKKVRIAGKKNEFLSTHSGRRTFITLALQSGMPADYVMKITGISEYSTLQHYKGEFDDEKVKEYLGKVRPKNVIMKAN